MPGANGTPKNLTLVQQGKPVSAQGPQNKSNPKQACLVHDDAVLDAEGVVW